MSRFTVGLLLLALGTAESSAQSPLEAAGFMVGCWRGSAGQNRIIEEYYTAPTGNLMQGMTRFLGERTGTPGVSTIDFEFSLLDIDQDRIRLRPLPKGQLSVAFAERERATGRLVWENPAHDFPQRISYTQAPGDSLIARIEGTTAQGERATEWRMGRVACPGAR